MEIRLRDMKTGRIKGKKIHAIYYKNKRLRPYDFYPKNADRIYDAPFVLDGENSFGEREYYSQQDNNDIGYTFTSRQACRGFYSSSLRTSAFSANFWIRLKQDGRQWANQGISLGFGQYVTLNFQSKERGFSHRFEHKKGSKYIPGPSNHGLGDGNWHFVSINMDHNGLAIFIDGNKHREKRNQLSRRPQNFDTRNAYCRLVNDGNPHVEYAHISMYKNIISFNSHKRIYNEMKEHFLSTYK